MKLYTGGTFDIFHLGHARFLAAAARFGDVTVSLNTDDFVRTYKGDLPVNSYDARAEVLQSCRFVSEVIPNLGGADSKPAILAVAPELIAIGSDWASRDYYAQMGFTPDWLRQYDIQLIYIPYTAGVSSTALRRHIVD